MKKDELYEVQVEYWHKDAQNPAGGYKLMKSLYVLATDGHDLLDKVEIAVPDLLDIRQAVKLTNDEAPLIN